MELDYNWLERRLVFGPPRRPRAEALAARPAYLRRFRRLCEEGRFQESIASMRARGMIVIDPMEADLALEGRR